MSTAWLFTRPDADNNQAGCFFGALLAFPFAERIGRKKTMIIASTVFLLGGTLMTASNGKLNMIYGGRAVAGLGIGASSMVSIVHPPTSCTSHTDFA